MANPSFAPPPVMISCHPEGLVTLDGRVSRKSFPGTQANQNVPTVVEPVSCSVTLYCHSAAASWVAVMVADAVSAKAQLLRCWARRQGPDAGPRHPRPGGRGNRPRRRTQGT